MLSVISFDVNNTLIDYYYLDYVWNEAIPRLYARKEDLDFKEAKDYVLKEYDQIGIHDIRWYLPQYWFKRFDLDEDPMEVFRLHTDKIRFYQEVPIILKNLREKYDLVIASGVPTNIIEIIIKNFRFFFKHIFSAISDLRQVKKTPEFYKLICKKMKIEPSVIVHVGDDYESDFITPRKINIKSFLLDRTGEKTGKFIIKDLVELENLLVNL